MMVKIEKIKRIAESLGFETRLAWGEVIEILASVYDGGMEDWQIFNPYENDADAFKVLEALWKNVMTNSQGLLISRSYGIRLERYTEFDTYIDFSDMGDDLKTAICEAYLAARGKT